MSSDKENNFNRLYTRSIFIEKNFNNEIEELEKLKKTRNDYTNSYEYFNEMKIIIDESLKKMLDLKKYIDQMSLQKLSAEIDELENLSQKYRDTFTNNYLFDAKTLYKLFLKYQEKFSSIMNLIKEYKLNIDENFNSEDLSEINERENNGTEQDSIEDNEGSLEEEGILSLEERINNIRINQNQSYAEQVFLVIIEYQLEMIEKDIDNLQKKINDKSTIEDLVSLEALKYQRKKLIEMKSKPYILSLSEKKNEKKISELYSKSVNISQNQDDDTTTLGRMSPEKKRKKIMALRNKMGKITESQRNIGFQKFDDKYNKMLRSSKLKAKFKVYKNTFFATVKNSKDCIQSSTAFQIMKKATVRLKGANRIEEEDDLEIYPDEEGYDDTSGRSR